MKHIKSSVVAMAGLVLATATSQASLINGDFEDLTGATVIGPGVGTPSSGGWQTYSSIPGWTAAPTSLTPGGIEIGNVSNYGVSGAGLSGNVLELDSTLNATVASTSGLTGGGSYTLSFYFAGRGGYIASSTFTVDWDGTLYNFTPLSSAAQLATLTLPDNGGINTLSFIGTGPSDSFGAIIDNVSLTPVPEASTVVAGALLLLPLGASALRGFRKNRIV